MKETIIYLFIILMIVVATVSLTANYIIYNLEVVNITGKTIELRIMGENHFYASASN